ncbi:phenylalanine--tRNA ligase alpha subunit, cytoplasmic-like [Cimex lectularius]|uniref:Aminoacyl-transfer RNA synthetases class-II family profile domain-containing protein n=1 Tax=Cimex lectularius TaxID=79782 RepID=A0A8I6TIU4_CIMLE|nr:phenylalanine--tRNA ligase alpha subunit, cytoplasmic-like [Cimex lectularius]
MELCNRIIRVLSNAHKDSIIASQFLANNLQCEHKNVVDCIRQLQKINDFLLVEEQEDENDEESQFSFNGVNVRKGRNFDPKMKVSSELTDNILQSEDWKKYYFLPYDFDKMGDPASGGQMNYVLNFLRATRDSLLELGFQEALAHSRYVDSEENNTLTVSLKDEVFFTNKSSYLQTEESVFKTMVREIKAYPAKLFSVGKAFKNIKDDNMKLHEFHDLQILLADEDVHFSDLIGIIVKFFEKIGIGKVEFKPGYSPLTEPTLDTTIYHGELDKWLTIGSAGMVREEIIEELVDNTNVTFLHWKFSIEKLSLVKLDATDVKEVLLSSV